MDIVKIRRFNSSIVGHIQDRESITHLERVGEGVVTDQICFSTGIKENLPLENVGLSKSQKDDGLYCIDNGYRANFRQRV